MSVIGRRALDRVTARRDDSGAEEFRDLITDLIAELLPQLIVDCLADPLVVRALRASLKPGTSSAGPSPLRAAEVKARRRV